jgi:hypothetical protein
MMEVYEWAQPPVKAHVFMLKFGDDKEFWDEFWEWCKVTMKGKIHLNSGTHGATLLNHKGLPRDDYTTPYHTAGYYGVSMVLVEDDNDAMLFKLKWMV